MNKLSKNQREFVLLIGLVLLCQFAGTIGTFFTISAIPDWYATLVKPSFSPPNWLFGPVWITLYTMMGMSVFFIVRKGLKKREVKSAFKVFLVHLVFNALWSILFFGLRNPGIAFIEIILMWGLIILTMYKFWPIDRRAVYLLMPYLLWVSFASILNFAIWRLNG